MNSRGPVPILPQALNILAALSLASGLVAHGAMLLLGFVTTPLLLRWLGAELFGAYRGLKEPSDA